MGKVRKVGWVRLKWSYCNLLRRLRLGFYQTFHLRTWGFGCTPCWEFCRGFGAVSCQQEWVTPKRHELSYRRKGSWDGTELHAWTNWRLGRVCRWRLWQGGQWGEVSSWKYLLFVKALNITIKVEWYCILEFNLNKIKILISEFELTPSQSLI